MKAHVRGRKAKQRGGGHGEGDKTQWNVECRNLGHLGGVIAGVFGGVVYEGIFRAVQKLWLFRAVQKLCTVADNIGHPLRCATDGATATMRHGGEPSLTSQ